ncbi:hypothetical protein B0J11DRAFT_335725 [Dendryphion nanum]|uniref:Stress-response A/B barrel domain-containing protein n=1 Tax=Dendryphion nanum TaxID=256645 RepID=A0A9P9DNS7_9PLEO|nr:hypothetical protein B0J11DRAFT_335725 [Dendryphion nanum]
MTIVHIVLFEFKSSAPAEKVVEAVQSMLDLREKCIHPTTQRPYIKSFEGGKNNSPEGHAGGLTHGFVVEFNNEEDRDYYINNDPAHRSFINFVGGILEKVRVLDFAPGKF